MNEVIAAAWDRVVENWDDPARHDALLALVAQHTCYAWAAARYKERAGDPIADKQLERLRRAATATLLASATSRPTAETAAYRKTLLWFVALMLLIVVGLVLARVAVDIAPARRPTPARP